MLRRPTSPIGAPLSPGGVDASKSFGNSLECDYDLNPSVLYQAIEAKQWAYAAKFFGKADGAVQAATWVTRKEKNGKLRWRLLPIHAAIIFGSPLQLIELLLQSYPAGAQQKDDQGMLPIHLAFRNDAEWDVLEELLTAFPQGVTVRDRKGRTPIQCATSKRASVMDLYAQVTISSERQRNVADSHSAIDARVAALQESHANTLANLKDEWEYQQENLEKELEDSNKALQITALRLEETSTLLAQKSITEVELTQRLEMVTKALQTVNEARVVDTRAIIADSEKSSATKMSVSELEERNKELLHLVNTLLEQQTALKALLDKQSEESKDTVEKKVTLLRELSDLHIAEADSIAAERDFWRSKLGESNDLVSFKLKSIVESKEQETPEKSTRGGKGP